MISGRYAHDYHFRHYALPQLKSLKDIGHSAGGTVNDALIACPDCPSDIESLETRLREAHDEFKAAL
jgi:hypothetical protein